MGTFGLQLRRARESRGVRLVEAAKATKIAAHNLVALEYQDFDALPDDEESITGYVRTYAEYLGLESEPLVADCAGELEARRPEPALEAEEESIQTPSEAGDERKFAINPWLLIAAGGLIVVLALTGWCWLDSGDAHEPAIRNQEPPVTATSAEAEHEPANAAPAESEPPPEPAPEARSVRLSISEHGVGTGVRNRRLVGAGDRFAEGTPVYFWTLVRGGRAGDTILHVWIQDGRVADRVPLEVNSSYWRTQSRRTLTPGSLGHWVVEARDEADNVLARSAFECVER